ncbi:hypothetical protein CERZMDRAFT_88337 [Cercospora zeae-maydis SCOH1-5]|uniref:Uncharacterized protein n=1 Tax=Cercospora zeae-maydis SCOH1-5 TaxID=717836 RepID=A0A6A6F2J3_9PEZI|nr:hypothetical protein CERZMDRAFT_88337 [Cercospora zeae-maydis SCOH1-5]
MEDHLPSMRELFETAEQLLTAIAENKRQVRERARLDRARIAEFEQEERSLSVRLPREESLRQEEADRTQSAYDDRLDDIALVKNQVRTADQKVEALKRQLQDARGKQDVLNSRLNHLQRQAQADRKETHGNRKRRSHEISCLISALASIRTELEQKRKGLLGVEAELTTERTPMRASSSSESDRADATRPESSIVQETCNEQERSVELTPHPAIATLPADSGSAQSLATTTACRGALGSSPAAPKVSEATLSAERCSPTATRKTHTQPESPLQIPQDRGSSSRPTQPPPSRAAISRLPATMPRPLEHGGTAGPSQEPPNTRGEYGGEAAHSPSRIPEFFATEASDRDQMASKPQTNAKTPFLVSAAGIQLDMDEGARVTVSQDEIFDEAYEKEMHECSLSKTYPTAVYIKNFDGEPRKWCELTCFHISRSHGIFPRSKVAEGYIAQKFTSEDVERLRAGRSPLRSTAAPPAGMRPPTNGSFKDNEAIEDAPLTSPPNETQDSSSPHTIERSGGLKRPHSEMTPAKASGPTGLLLPASPPAVFIDETWPPIKCPACFAKYNILWFFDGLNELGEHIPGFKLFRRPPVTLDVNKSQWVESPIVHHAGDKSSEARKPNMIAAVKTGYLSPNFPMTIKIDNTCFHISCKICKANVDEDLHFFNGIRSLGNHIRTMHGQETDFNDLSAWCQLDGPIPHDKIASEVKKWGFCEGFSVKVSKGDPASNIDEGRNPRLKRELQHDATGVDRSTLDVNDLFHLKPHSPSRAPNMPQRRSSASSPPTKRSKINDDKESRRVPARKFRPKREVTSHAQCKQYASAGMNEV